MAVIMKMTHTKPNTAWPIRPIGELLRRVRQPVDVQLGQTYQEIGIRSHCKGIFHKTPTTSEEIGNKRVFWVKPGCLIFNIIFAWEQAVAMTSEDEAGMIASHRFPMYTSRNGKLLPEYAWRYFSSSRGKYDLGIASPGGAGRNKTLGQAEFDQLKIPVPPLAHQRIVVDTLAAADRATARTENLIAAKRKLKEGLAQQLLTGKRRLPGFTERWRDAYLRNLCVMAYGKSQKGIDSESGCFPIFGTGGVVGLTNKALHPGPAIILGRKGSIDRPYLASGPFWAIDTTFYAVPAEDVSVEWLYQNFRTIRWRRFNEATGVPSLSRDNLYRIRLKTPSRDEQERIATVIGAVDRSLEILEQKLASLHYLKHGLMQKLLPSEPRVEAS